MLKEILREIISATSRDNFTRFFHAYFQQFFIFRFTYFENYFLHLFVHCGRFGILIINDKQFINHSFELFVISVINNLSLKKLFVSTKQLIQHQELIFFFQKLKKQRDQLQQYQRRIESVLEKDRQLAKKLLNEGKRE